MNVIDQSAWPWLCNLRQGGTARPTGRKFFEVEAQIEKVTEMPEIIKYRILATPALVINEKVVCAGRIPTAAEVTTWLTNALA